MLDEMIRNPVKDLLCLDEERLRGIEIYGNENDNDHQRIEFILLPCNYLHKGYAEDTIHPECIGDLKA